VRVLITRHQAAADRLATELGSQGFESVIDPMLVIHPTGDSLSLEGIQAILLTSANGADALALATSRREIPVFAVGDATTQATVEAGFSNIQNAKGDAAALAGLVIAKADTAAGALLHVSGGHVAGDLTGVLERAGFTIRRTVLYQAGTPDALSRDTCDLLGDDKIDAVLFFSPRTASTFVTLIRQAGVADRCAGVWALCLSDAVAEASAGLAWRGVAVAASPDTPALIDALRKLDWNGNT
jgi:uroporphyrinogen-III synthase